MNMLKYGVGKRLIIDNNNHSNHRFVKGEVVRIIQRFDDDTKDEHYLVQSEGRGVTWYVVESELTNKCTTETETKGANTMNMKHDGYVVVNLTDGVVSFNLTKEQAESEVDFYLKDDIDAENILVFPPNSNLPFSHGVKLMD